MKCRVCSSSLKEDELKKLKTKCRFSGENLIRYRCPHCDVIFGNTRMLNLSFEELCNEYEQHYKIHSEADNTSLEISLLKSISPTPIKSNLYLNWGCGGGWNKTLQEASSAGYNLLGYDIASKKSELVINDIKELEKGSVTGIISNNYIEHMQYPINEFSSMNSILKDGSIMIHSTPCWGYFVEWTKFHLFFLEGRSLEVLCDRTGFRILPNFNVPKYPYQNYPNADTNIKVFEKIRSV